MILFWTYRGQDCDGVLTSSRLSDGTCNTHTQTHHLLALDEFSDHNLWVPPAKRSNIQGSMDDTNTEPTVDLTPTDVNAIPRISSKRQ